jgi:hypothetical protein
MVNPNLQRHTYCFLFSRESHGRPVTVCHGGAVVLEAEMRVERLHPHLSCPSEKTLDMDVPRYASAVGTWDWMSLVAISELR